MLDNLTAILEQGNDIMIFTLEYPGLGMPSLDSIAKVEPESRENLFGHFRGFFERRRTIESVQQIDRWEPDVVILNKNCGFAGWMSGQLKAPLVAYVHDVWSLMRTTALPPPKPMSSHAIKNWLYKSRHRFDIGGLLNRGLGSTRLVISPSEWLAHQIRSAYPEVRCAVIPHGVKHSQFAPTWEDKGYLLCSGRMHREKNFELAIGAAKSARIPLVIAGSTGNKSDKTHAQAMRYVEELRALGGGQVQFKLDINDEQYVRLLQGCSLYLNTGKKEVFGLAPLEAMACGKPVIAVGASGIRETVDGGGIILGEDPDEWGMELNRMMASSSLRLEHGKRAHDYSMNFTWEKTAALLTAAITDTIGWRS